MQRGAHPSCPDPIDLGGCALPSVATTLYADASFGDHRTTSRSRDLLTRLGASETNVHDDDDDGVEDDDDDDDDDDELLTVVTSADMK
jgi:hypothetical protein